MDTLKDLSIADLKAIDSRLEDQLKEITIMVKNYGNFYSNETFKSISQGREECLAYQMKVRLALDLRIRNLFK